MTAVIPGRRATCYGSFHDDACPRPRPRSLAGRGGRLPVADLKSAAAEVFGAEAVYGNCHGDRFDFEGLLSFLSSAGKVSLEGDVASLGRVPGCSGH
jgi:hypothetical protein